MTTAQTGLSVSAPQAYREKIFKMLGERDPLEVMAQTASQLGQIVREYSPSVLRSRPLEGKWTPNEVIGHLVDSEWVYGYRLRLILSEDNPTILGTNQDSWVARQRHNEREPAELERTGHHNERGPESLAVMLRLLAGHDLSHLDQIRRYIEAARQAA